MNTGLYIYHRKQPLLYRLYASANKFRKFVGDYLYYRKRRHGHKMAWRMARDTL